jgi:hypothetical protein
MKQLLLILDLLFKGGSLLTGLKAGAWLMLGLLICAINERGEADGVYRKESLIALAVGFALAVFSVVWSLIRETQDERR